MSFPATYPGICCGCKQPFAKGDWINNVPSTTGHTLYAHPDCDIPDSPPDTSDDDMTTPADAVMPRGLTAADRCEECFIIHSPGQEECW